MGYETERKTITRAFAISSTRHDMGYDLHGYTERERTMALTSRQTCITAPHSPIASLLKKSTRLPQLVELLLTPI